MKPVLNRFSPVSTDCVVLVAFASIESVRRDLSLSLDIVTISSFEHFFSDVFFRFHHHNGHTITELKDKRMSDVSVVPDKRLLRNCLPDLRSADFFDLVMLGRMTYRVLCINWSSTFSITKRKKLASNKSC